MKKSGALARPIGPVYSCTSTPNVFFVNEDHIDSLPSVTKNKGSIDLFGGLVPQNPLQDLAGGTFGQFIHEFH